MAGGLLWPAATGPVSSSFIACAACEFIKSSRLDEEDEEAKDLDKEAEPEEDEEEEEEARAVTSLLDLFLSFGAGAARACEATCFFRQAWQATRAQSEQLLSAFATVLPDRALA